MVEMTEREYRRLVRAARGQRGGIGGFLFTLACLVPVLLLVARVGPEVAIMYGVPLPFAATAGVVFSTAAPAALPPATIRENPLPPIPTPRIEQRPAIVVAPEQLTPAPPTPIPTAFWTEEERAAWTATAEAFYKVETLPTAPPAFVEAVEEACQDPEQVADSDTLRLFCKK